jgi:hypothetical protein
MMSTVKREKVTDRVTVSEFRAMDDTGGEVQIDNHLEFGGYSRFQVMIQSD